MVTITKNKWRRHEWITNSADHVRTHRKPLGIFFLLIISGKFKLGVHENSFNLLHTPYRALLPHPEPTYYRYKSMCMEIESCGGVADCLTSLASARHFRSPDVFTGRNNTRHRLRGPKWRAHDCSPSREECPCLEDDQGHSR